jgi:hypothetical protein
LAVDAEKAVLTAPGKFVCKATLKRLKREFKTDFESSLQVGTASPLLKCDDLEHIAKKVKKPAKVSVQA